MTLRNLASADWRRGDQDRAMEFLEAAIRTAPHPGLYGNPALTPMMVAEVRQNKGNQFEVQFLVMRAKASLEQALSHASSERTSLCRDLRNPAQRHALLGQVRFSIDDTARASLQSQAALGFPRMDLQQQGRRCF